MSQPEVEICEGKLKGFINKTLTGNTFYTFRGIPYAKPPIGDLRFANPEPCEPWEGVRDATKDCNICAQYDKATNTFIGDEDCLYLNVYTTCISSGELPEYKPVMVFLHGGGFLFGNGTDDAHHGPDYLVEKGVVVVSLNYRLGILGFLALGCKDATGNMGLKDQLLALKWVQRNIVHFGGNPNNVTIFGVSAGGASVEYLLLSPLTRGLFHKAIAQSGSSLLHWAQNNKIKELAFKIPNVNNKVIKDDNELLKYLKEMPVKELIQASMAVIATDDKWRGGIHFGFVPTVEQSGDWEQFINKSTYKMLCEGEFANVPFMSGYCTREGLLMLGLNAPKVEKLAREKSFISELPFNFDETEREELETKLRQVYLDGDRSHKDDDYYAIDFFTDVDFLGGVYVATSLIAKKSSPVYFYEFSYSGQFNYIKKKMNIAREGACHGDEGGYLIKCDIFNEEDICDADKLVRDRMATMWTNFAKFGDPTPKIDNIINVKWEPVTDDRMAYLLIDEDLSMRKEPFQKRTKLYEELYQKYNVLFNYMCEMNGPEVEISEGKLRGAISTTINGVQFYTFKGIPYAKPPIGELRFSIPEPPEPWDDVRDATLECNISAQYDKTTGTVVGAEDCLYLNVYTPHLYNKGSKLPVMVFLHGGGFTYLNGTDQSAHGPDFLVEKNVVIVSLNYRLGILGFLSLDRKEAPGNMGLRDQLLALKWVQKNIRQFCGDPENVTVFGFSAGGACVEYLLVSPLSEGLFHKAIAQSGSSLLHWAQNNDIRTLASKIPAAKGESITNDHDLLQYLQQMPVEELIEASLLVSNSVERRGGLHFGFVPTIEKQGEWEQVINKSTYKLLLQGEFMKVPFISGFCTREGLSVLPAFPKKLEKLVTEKEFVSQLPFDFEDLDKNEMENKLKAIYLDGEKINEDEDSFAIDFLTDVDFLGGLYVASSLIAKANSPVYFYEFSYDGNLNFLKKKANIVRLGASHADDAGYLIKAKFLREEEASDTDKLVRDRMVTMWTNFAKYGNPTPRIDNIITTKWQPVTEDRMMYLFIDDKLTMKCEPNPERTHLLKELYTKYYNCKQ
ncbi:uncharacterized protein [Battus philenor]|uniref:uncharacterized protein n=1 Tax=Battus philenor TaxID=42288 RepID=UPI0035CE93C4